VAYLWIKAVHVMAIISWMAGLLYIFRLYVNHAMESEAVVRDRFSHMERRLLNYITTPAMVVSVATGVTMLLIQPELLKAHWMHVKLTCVVGLLVMHGLAILWRKQLIDAPGARPHRFYRIMNEIPTVLMIIIVIMVIRRPF
jgi:protoporphyrinogen IX oxidase